MPEDALTRVKQTKQNWPPAEVPLKHLPNRLHWNPGLVEIQVHQRSETPDDIARGPLDDTCAMKGSKRGTSIVDRIALVAAFSVAILILVMFELTGKSALELTPATATVSMSSYFGLPVSKPNHRMSTMTTTAGKD